jgi:hypothetical protein
VDAALSIAPEEEVRSGVQLFLFGGFLHETLGKPRSSTATGIAQVNDDEP